MKHTLNINAYGREPIEGESILDALKDNRIVKVEPQDDGTFYIEDGCDGAFGGTLTQQQLFDLGTELHHMATREGEDMIEAFIIGSGRL